MDLKHCSFDADLSFHVIMIIKISAQKIEKEKYFEVEFTSELDLIQKYFMCSARKNNLFHIFWENFSE